MHLTRCWRQVHQIVLHDFGQVDLGKAVWILPRLVVDIQIASKTADLLEEQGFV